MFRGLRADTDQALAAASEAAKQAALAGAREYAGKLAKIAEYKGHIEQIWAAVHAGLQRMSNPPALAKAVETVQAKYFNDNAPIYEKVVAAGRGDGRYPFDIPEYRHLHVPGLNSLLL